MRAISVSPPLSFLLLKKMEGEEECGSLKVRTRKGKMGNPGSIGCTAPVELGESERSVYFDRDQGLWKCRHCIWTYRMESPGIDHVHNFEECSNQVMNTKTSSQRESCFSLQIKGIKSTDEITGERFNSVGLFGNEKKIGNDEANFETKNLENQNGLPIVGNHRSPKHVNPESPSSLLLTFSEGECENGLAKFEPVKNRSGANVNGRLVDASKMVLEMDVEKVLEEQDTHDLYCPNCKSCITKRVILRKRKRIVRDLQADAKREKIQPLLQPDLEASPDAAVANDPSHVTDPDLFRCLSCFSFFVPTATGFKLFPIFERNDEGESLQSPRQAPTKNVHCISSIFEMFMGKQTGNEPGKDIIQEEIVQPLIPSQHLDEGEALLHHTINSTSSMNGVHVPDKSSYVEEHIEDASRNDWRDKQSSLVLLMPRSSMLQETQIGKGEKVGSEVKQNNAGNGTQLTERGKVNLLNPSPYLDKAYSYEKNGTFSLIPTGQIPENLHINGGKQVGEDTKQIPFKDEENTLISSKPAVLLLGEAQVGIGGNFMGEPKEHIAGNVTAQVESKKVNSMSPLPFLGRTLSDENSTISLIPSAQPPQCLKINGGNGVKDPDKRPSEDDKNILISSNQEAFLHGGAQVDVGENLVEAPKKNVAGIEAMQNNEMNKLNVSIPSPFSGEIWPDERNSTISIIQNDHLLENPCIGGGKQLDNPEPKPLEDENANLISSEPEALVTGKIDNGEILEDTPNNNVAVADMIQPVEDMVKLVKLVPSQSKDNVPALAAPGLLPETRIEMGKQRVNEAETREYDILKSIVYGGLIETVISLGVVSSAAGSDATTLNIVGLGVANLISGLVVIVHNLRELKKDSHSSIDQEGRRLNRYQATLGRRGNFRLHATVAVLSYILFGLLPPVIYGFSFRKSDNKEHKLIAVAAASLLCITLLATGKAHVREAPKNYVKTILYYVSIGVMASGLSYVAGELLKKLLERLGLFDSSAAASVSSNLGFLEMEAMNSRWASY